MTSRRYQFFKNFYDNSDEMRLMIITNPSQFKIVNFSKPFLNVLGYTEKELLEIATLESLIHPDYYESLEQAKILYLKQGFLNDHEISLKTKNGNKVLVYADVISTKDKEGNILFTHFLYKYIPDGGNKTSFEAAKVQLNLESLNKTFLEAQDFYQYFHDFYEDAPDMLASTSITADMEVELEQIGFSHCNKTLAQKLGYSKEEVLNMKMISLHHPDCWDELNMMKSQLLKHGHVSNLELLFKKKNGDVFPVSLNAKVRLDSHGKKIIGIGMWRDITELVEARRQLQETNDLLTRQNEEIKTLMHIMSHDIQSPIRAIGNFTQFILEENKENLSATSLNFLYKLQVNTKRLYHLTQDVISYFFKGSLENIEDTNLKDIVDQVLAYLDLPPLIKIQFKSDIKDFKTKKTLLTQIFYNLISNAIKYHHNPDAAEICIEAKENNENLFFTVRDNGPGIAPKFHKTVFEPLQRLKAVNDVEGSGMGLAIVEKLIAQEGGKISLESDVGKGATFTFTWPKHTQ